MADSVLEAYLRSVRDDAADTVVLLDRAVHAAAPVDAAIKWGRLTYAVGGDFHHWICGISVTQKAVTMTFHFGGLLPDPEGEFRRGSSAFGRMLDYPSPESVDDSVVERRVREAVGALEYFKANWKAIAARGSSGTA